MDIKQIRRENLKDLVDRLAGGSKTKFADMLDMNEAYIGQMLMDPSKKTSRNIGDKTARKIETAVGLTYGYMDHVHHAGEGVGAYDEGIEVGPSYRGKAPLISWVTAGDPNLAIDLLAPGDAEEWVPGPPVTHSDSIYVLRVRGDSMTSSYGKSYPNGCLIYVDPEQRGGAGIGDRVIAKINGQDAVTFKQLAEDGGRMFLKPLNPQYPAIFDEFRVLGKIIFKGEAE